MSNLSSSSSNDDSNDDGDSHRKIPNDWIGIPQHAVLPLTTLITIGASAGGVEPLLHLVRRLPPDLPAAVLIVVHSPPHVKSVLPDLLSHAGPLPARHAQEGEPVLPGHLYVAPPDRHLLVEAPATLRLSAGPRENHSRPAIDPLFRSAALAFGPRVIGVILSGALSDGTAGLWEIKQRGGIAIVQDPGEAAFPSMPHSALDQVPIDHVLPVADIAALLPRLAAERATAATVAAAATMVQQSEQQEDEKARAQKAREGTQQRTPQGARTMVAAVRGSNGSSKDGSRVDNRPGSAAVERDMADQVAGQRDEAISIYVCPDCGGSLWQANAGPITRFRCHVGHLYGGEDLLEALTENLEGSMWRVARSLHDKANLARQLANSARGRGDGEWAARYKDKARQDEEHAHAIEQMIAAAATVNRGQ